VDWNHANQQEGEVKKQEQKQCQHGPDVKVEKTPIGRGSKSRQP
jgi:hypothetical protein